MAPDPFDGLDPEAVAELLSRPADDPRRRALLESPRGRALLTAYRAFVDPPDAPAGADAADARVRLRAVLDAEEARAARQAGTASASAPAERPGFWSRLWSGWGLGASIPLVATAAAVAILILAEPPGDVPVARIVPTGGVHRGAPAAGASLRLEVHGVGDEARLVWQPVAGAPVYEVEVRTPAHTTLARWRVVAPSTPLSELVWPEGEAASPVALWRVTVLDEDEVRMRSGWATVDASRPPSGPRGGQRFSSD